MSRADFDHTADMSPTEYLDWLEAQMNAALDRAPIRPPEEDETGHGLIFWLFLAIIMGAIACGYALAADWIWGCADFFCGVEPGERR